MHTPIVLLSVLLLRLATASAYDVFFNLSSELPLDVAQTGRSLPVSLLPVALAMAGPALALALGALKPVLLALGLLYLSLFVLAFIPVVGDLMEASFRTLHSSFTDAATTGFVDDMLSASGLDKEVCRTRAVCEITEEAVRKYPTMAAMLRSLTGAVQAQGSNESVLKGLLGGLSGLGCESLYSMCTHSVFEKFFKSIP